MAREYFCAYHSMIKPLQSLTDGERGRLFMALLQYSAGETLIGLNGREEVAFAIYAEQIDRDRESYEAKCRKNRENGENGGKRTPPNAPERPRTPPNAPERPRTPPNAPQGEDKGKGKGKEEGKGKGKVEEGFTPPTPPRGAPPAKSRFVPPSVDEVRAYCRERGNRVDPERFVDFYTAKGWKVGREPMKDWKAAVRTWEKRDEAERPKTALPDYDNMEDLPC